MQWEPGGISSDIEDDRGSSGGGFGFGGGGFGGFHIGCGGAIVLIILSLLFHRNFFALLSGGGGPAPQRIQRPVQESPQEHREVQFVSFVLDDVQKTWDKTLPQYHHAKLVLFRDSIDSACGFAQSATGPFYCPEDEKVYIDLGFYDELRQRFGAPGEFAQAYVIAHEIGHHVQKILGTEQRAHALMERSSSRAKQISVRLELQADCYAGIWGHSTQQRGMIDNADIEQGLNAAAAIGDDRLQRMAGRAVNPESFTHGSSAQRVEWFRRGLESGQIADCDTFGQ